jgi:flagellar assembly protein FliH
LAKNVFRPTEVIQGSEKVFIPAPENSPYKTSPEPELIEEFDDYSGPTADDLRREADLFRAQWEKEKEKMITEARIDAERIVKEAEASAFEQVKIKTEEAASLRREAEEEAERLKAEADRQAEDILRESRSSAEALREEARKAGFSEGREEGWKDGRAEADRIIERLHLVLSKIIDRRSEILSQSEVQIVHLILQIAKKVVKVISENQKNIVINNAVQALQKLKNKSDVIIRVNLQDVNLMTEHTKDIIARIENVKSVTILEDAAVDRGGCIIETDFGEIDARIAAQLREIEERILELAPIQQIQQK